MTRWVKRAALVNIADDCIEFTVHDQKLLLDFARLSGVGKKLRVVCSGSKFIVTEVNRDRNTMVAKLDWPLVNCYAKS